LVSWQQSTGDDMEKKIRKSTIRKFETIIVKLECLQPEIPSSSINHELNQLKSRLIDILRRMEGE
jgi:hypothetical protein